MDRIPASAQLVDVLNHNDARFDSHTEKSEHSDSRRVKILQRGITVGPFAQSVGHVAQANFLAPASPPQITHGPERISQVTLPSGFQPSIGPDYSPVGQLYSYTLTSTSPQYDLRATIRESG